MFTRCLSFSLSCLLLLAVSAWAQTGDISTPGSPGSSDPGLVPFSNPNVGVRPSSNASNTADHEGKIKFRTQAILVQVPVVVSDKSGNHIHGLTKDGFHIFENGKEQKIAAFEEIVTANAKLSVVAPKQGEFVNLALSDQQPRTVTVIALDTINTPFLDQATSRRELVKFLADNLDSGQVLALMVMTSRGLKVIQGLTGDHEQLVQELKKASGEMPAVQGIGTDVQANAAAGDIPDLGSIIASALNHPLSSAESTIAYGETTAASVQQPKAMEETLNAFLEIAWSLSGVPGRKSLIWATGGFPFEISSPEQLPGPGYLSSLYERTLQALDAAQVAVYPVDVRGLVESTFSAVRDNTGPKLINQISDRNSFQQSTIETLNTFADMTGGKAFYNTNDLASSFKRAANDASSYYLASYYLDTHNNNSGWRQLKVKVDKADTEVRARVGFFVTNATMNADLTRSSDLTYALSSPIEGTGVPMSVKWLGTSGGTKKKTEFIIHMPAGSVSIEASNGQNRLNFDFAAAAYVNSADSGKPIVTTSRTVSMSVPEAQLASLRGGGIEMKNAIELSPGSYTVRVVIRDNVTGKIGSVTAPLIVN